MCDFAFDNALKSNSGVVGENERTGELSCIDFNEIRGDKGLDINSKWFLDLVHRIENWKILSIIKITSLEQQSMPR